MNHILAGEVEIRFNSSPSADVLADIRHRAILAHENASRYLASGGTANPFIILTPHGWNQASSLAAQLVQLGVRVVSRVPVRDWPRTATPLYLRRFDHDSLLQAAIYEESWKGVSPLQTCAERWDLADESDLVRVTAAKKHLRSAYPTLYIRATLPGASVPIGLHTFHSPDVDRWPVEFAYLRETDYGIQSRPGVAHQRLIVCPGLARSPLAPCGTPEMK